MTPHPPASPAPAAGCALRSGAALRILDQFEVDIVRQTQDAADDLRRGKPDRVAKQLRHIGLPFGLNITVAVHLTGSPFLREARSRPIYCTVTAIWTPARPLAEIA
jgi:hypothetical protein